MLGYEIPAAGQLQVVLKNPNKTAVKLFLIPYDFSDMPNFTKTFMRQKSYAADGTLRYAVHFIIVSTGKGKKWLTGRMKVVFANRAAGDETQAMSSASSGSRKLHIEIQHPDVKYAPFKVTEDFCYTPSSFVSTESILTKQLQHVELRKAAEHSSSSRKQASGGGARMPFREGSVELR